MFCTFIWSRPPPHRKPLPIITNLCCRHLLCPDVSKSPLAAVVTAASKKPEAPARICWRICSTSPPIGFSTILAASLQVVLSTQRRRCRAHSPDGWVTLVAVVEANPSLSSMDQTAGPQWRLPRRQQLEYAVPPTFGMTVLPAGGADVSSIWLKTLRPSRFLDNRTPLAAGLKAGRHHPTGRLR